MPALKITYPESPLQIRAGSYYQIKFEKIGIVTSVNIELWESTTPAKISTIALDVEQEYYLWEVDNNLTARDDYYIKIITTDSAYTDVGTDFEILEKKLIGDFSDLANLEKVVLVELKAGIEIPLAGWSLASGNSAGQNSYEIEFTGREMVAMDQNGMALTRQFSETECDTTESSFCHDVFNKILYVHLTGNISPAASNTFLVGYVWLCFTNNQDSDYIIDFVPQNNLTPVFYMPYLSLNSIPSVTQAVGEYFRQIVTTQFGSLNFNNDGWFWSNKNLFLWHNKECYVKLGEKNTSYDNFVTIFPGHTRKPKWSDKQVVFNLRDQRAGVLKDIPVDYFDIVDFPNLHEKEINEKRSILFGIKTAIVPALVNTTNFTFEISQTVFNGTTYALKSIDNVYVNDTEIYETFNYTIDLNAGTITLLDDPKDSEVRVNAHGIKCHYDFATGLPTSTFSENVADILFFVLTELNNIPVSKIDLSSLLSLQTKRTQRLGTYLNKNTKTNAFIRLLQNSALFHFLPKLDGNYMVRYYDRDVDDDAPRNFDFNYKGFELNEDTDTCFENVILKYDKTPLSDEWTIFNASDDEAGYKYNEKSTLTIETALVSEAEAEVLADFYMQLINAPGDKLVAKLDSGSLNLIPTDKAYFSREIVDMQGDTISILDSELYIIIQARKNIQNATIDILALKDTQASGLGGHADIPHGDTTVDEYADDYTDVDHGDSYLDHDDGYYTDNYSDDHSDEYDQTAYVDTHDDWTVDDYTDYNDAEHADHYYTDQHGDTPGLDTPYTDNYSDHTDHNDYSDFYTQTVDDDHGDGHTDDHTDEHADSHLDTPHTDSET